MIKLQVLGYLGNDATVKEVNGRNVINFNVAHTEKYKTNDGVQKEKTTWVNCSYWVERTNVAPYLKKGTQVFVEGSPEARIYESQEGHKASLNLRVAFLNLLSSAQKNNNNTETVNQSVSENFNGSDDLPF